MVAHPDNPNPYESPKSNADHAPSKPRGVGGPLLVATLLLSIVVILTVPLLSLPAAIVLGWTASRLRHNLARIPGFAAAVTAIVLLITLALTGWQHEIDEVAEIHTWTAHGMAILVWIGAPYSIGVLVQQWRQRSILRTSLATIALIFVVAATLEGSFTGYLAPSSDPTISAETRTRFAVLHFYVVPSLLGGLLAIWFSVLRNKSSIKSKQHGRPVP